MLGILRIAIRINTYKSVIRIYIDLTMRFFREAPFVRLLIPFIAGIISAVYFFQNQRFLIGCSCLSLFLLIFIMGIKSHLRAYKYAWIAALAINGIVFFTAAQLTLEKTTINSPAYFFNCISDNSSVIAQLSEPFVEKGKSIKCVFKIRAVISGQKSYSVLGKALVYIEKDSLSLILKYGDEIMLPSKFIEVPGPQNPEQFDYKHYLAIHHINHQQYVKSKKWTDLHLNDGNVFMKFIYNLRFVLLNKIRAHHIKDDEFAVAGALLLGYNDKLDSELMSAYARTGTLHVLSVSGLHVGLVYIVFSFVFGFMDRFPHGKIYKNILIILLLWMYAALTGLSPAVLRAATMFSFIIAGQSLNRTISIYNTLAVSCFLLLLFDPYLIFDVGFQLSYIAVVGIVSLQPKIYEWFIFKNWLLDQIWKISSVSLAAQLATLPISFYYFHQFPNYFMISNLIVIPISTIVIYNGIFLLALDFVPFVGDFLGKTLNYSLLFLNGSVKFLGDLPFALWQGISPSIVECVLLYVLIISGILFFIKKRFSSLIVAFATTLILVGICLFDKSKNLNQQKLIVYNIPHVAATDIVCGHKVCFIADSTFASDKNKLRFYLQNNRWKLGVNSDTLINYTNNHFIKVHGQTILFISGDSDFKHLKTDYLVISGNCKIKPSELIDIIDFNVLIVDSSNSPKLAIQWKELCKKNNKKYYNVSESGAFVVDI